MESVYVDQLLEWVTVEVVKRLGVFATDGGVLSGGKEESRGVEVTDELMQLEILSPEAALLLERALDDEVTCLDQKRRHFGVATADLHRQRREGLEARIQYKP
jgi:hypothetical protein